MNHIDDLYYRAQPVAKERESNDEHVFATQLLSRQKIAEKVILVVLQLFRLHQLFDAGNGLFNKLAGVSVQD